MGNSTKTGFVSQNGYSAVEVNAGMQEGFIGFMQANKGKNPGAILQEMMSSGQISQEHLNMAQAMAQKLERQFSGIRGMFHF